MKDLQETIEQTHKYSESYQNDLFLKNENESIEKSPIFLKKVPLSSIYAKTIQHNFSIKTGSNTLNEDDFEQKTLSFNDTVKKNDTLSNLFKHEDASKQDFTYNKMLKENSTKKNSENNFEVCIHEKTPSKFLNSGNRLHNSPLLKGNALMESQLSISKNPWRNRLSEFSPPAKRKKLASESREGDDCVVFSSTENPLVDSIDTFPGSTKKQKVLQYNFNQTNIPLINTNNIPKDSSKSNQKKTNGSDQSNGGVGLLFSGLEKIRREREELERELNIKNAELLRTNSQLLSIKQKTKDIKFKFFGFQKFLDGLGRDHNSLHKEIIKWSNEIKSFQADIIKSRESLQGIIHHCEVLTHQGKLNSKVHKQLGEVKEELVKQNMYRKNLQEKYSKDASLLAEERDKVRFLEDQLMNERKEKNNQYSAFLKKQEVFEKLLQSFYEETQKNEKELKNMLTLWPNEVKTIENKILYEIASNFQEGTNILNPFLREVQEKWEKYSKESLSFYSDIKSFSNTLSLNNKRIENLENEIKQTNIKEKETYECLKKTDDFVQLIKSLQLEINELKTQLEKSKIDFEKRSFFSENNENCPNKFQDVKEVSEKLKIAEKNYEKISSENVKLQNTLKDITQELVVSRDECNSLKNRIKSLENSNSLHMDFVNNDDLKKQYEKEIAEHERRVLKLKETEQAKFDNIIKSKDNKINKLEKEILILKSLNSNDENNLKDDKLFYKEKLISMIGLEKTELIEKIKEQDNTINSLKHEMTKLLNKSRFVDDINKDSQKIKISQSSNRIIHQTPGKSDNASKINTTTPIHLASQIMSPPSENKIKTIYSNSLEHLNNESNKIKPMFTKNIKDYLKSESVTGNIGFSSGSFTPFTEVPENLLTPSNPNESLLLEKTGSPLIFIDDNIDSQNGIITPTELASQSLSLLGKENRKSIRNSNTHKNCTKDDENVGTIPVSEYLLADANNLKNKEDGSLKKKGQDKQRRLRKPSIEYNDDTNFWLTEQLENSMNQKNYSTRSITNTYKKKKNR
ncbi:hypothetical protein PORY_002280 [Pneumocystis oryctolagi]|uniref:Uncharacterized protein n=1 Tax=Pneumocystis oryctolagi TaxID=42067 RepID=A0ACB7CAA3_9ASCO|nr:hypothetical protein PORY_002280 [Pneumocystis oryctolagi]